MKFATNALFILYEFCNLNLRLQIYGFILFLKLIKVQNINRMWFIKLEFSKSNKIPLFSYIFLGIRQCYCFCLFIAAIFTVFNRKFAN